MNDKDETVEPSVDGGAEDSLTLETQTHGALDAWHRSETT